MDLRLIRQKFTGELALIIFFLIISAYMFFTARAFSDAASRFPLFSSAVVVILSVYLLFNIIYGRSDSSSQDGDLVQNVVSSTTDEFDIDRDDTMDVVPDKNNVRKKFIFMLLVFVTLSYVIGIFYSSLVFVAMYGLWRERTWYETVAMVVLAALIGLFFIIVLNVDLHTGIIDTEEIIW